jgi:RIO kinase 1
LRRLQERGFVHQIVGELKSGKEATVYLGASPVGDVAVKIFRDLEARSFKNDQRYRANRWVGDERLAKAIRHRSGRGRKALKAMWAAHEYLVLWRLHKAGVRVPEPLLGPEAFDIAEAGEVVVMRFVGDADDPAQRLADAALSESEVVAAADQALQLMRDCWRAGVVHGDFSAYNLLWWRGTLTLIDFPQSLLREPNAAQVPHAGHASEAAGANANEPSPEQVAAEKEHAAALALLQQDAASLALSLKRLGVDKAPEQIVAFVLEAPSA